LECTKEFLPTSNCPIFFFSPTSTLVVSTSKRLLGIWAPKKCHALCHIVYSIVLKYPLHHSPKLHGNCWMQTVFCHPFPISTTYL
jgi:hypothetical protein